MQNENDPEKGRDSYGSRAAAKPSTSKDSLKTALENSLDSTPKQPETQAAVLQFVCRFSPSLSCTVSVPDQMPAPGAAPDLVFTWAGRPKKKHLVIYRRWILSVIQHLADHWQGSIGYVLGVSPTRSEFWHCEPGQAPKLCLVIRAGIP